MTDQGSADGRGNGSVEDVSAGSSGSVEDVLPGGRSDVEGGAGERPLAPAQSAERADAIDEASAGDGVQFFEGEAAATGGREASDVEGGG